METSTSYDSEKAGAFADKLVDILNYGSAGIMISIGHRAALFDAMSKLPPSTSQQIAASAGKNERYVREWLGAMVTSRIVEFDASANTYSLPAEHAAFLTRAAGADNIAVFTQYLAVMGEVEDDILECFHSGGGVPYERFHRFHEVMAEDSGQSVLSSLESHIVPLVSGMSDRLSAGIRMLDVGCGSGRIINRLAALYPRSEFVGLDLSAEAVAAGRGEAKVNGLANVTFVAQDLSDFDKNAEPEAFDLITTFDAIHDQGKPMNVLKGIRRALKSDGVYLMQEIGGSGRLETDIAHPIGTFLYTISCMHCMTVSLAQGGEGLGAMWGEVKTREYLEAAGFRSIEKHVLPHDIQNNWYVIRK